ncbi:MAG: hypothetical protein JO262_16035 [Solirubrobacterales bacterium]|nr:hypothetical protein [Solirubrobacterales bacterium]
MLWLALVALPAPARADGDPASDVLSTEGLFVPQDAGISVPQQGQLATLVQGVSRGGYPIRAAIIASRSDLGSVTELWREPQTYAQFLAQELSLVYRGPLLVVMPSGLGFYNAGSSSGGERSVLRDVSISAHGTGLAVSALAAIQRLAGAAGHPAAIPPAAPTEGRSGTNDTVAIVAFAIGAALIILAWSVSLRARPPRVPRRNATSA